MEFSRDLANMKIEDELEKVLLEPEMTCLVEEDAKHEAFSTRIGRSFTFQKRGSLETGRYWSYNCSTVLNVKPYLMNGIIMNLTQITNP